MTVNPIAELRGQIARKRIRQRDLATTLGMNETLLSHILNGHRPMPAGMEARIHTALDRLEAAEKAAQAERKRVLAEWPNNR